MYKLFLCLRYLRSRVIAYFAVLAVALCVAMMLIVISVMSGFLQKVEDAAKGLFGDVIVAASGSLGGMGRYDEFIAELHEKVPQVESATPSIMTQAFLRDPDIGYRFMAQVVGIRLPQSTRVSDFERGLYFQQGQSQPSFNPPVELLLKGLDREIDKVKDMLDADTEPRDDAGELTVSDRALSALRFLNDAVFRLRRAESYWTKIADVHARLEAAEKTDSGQETEKVRKLRTQLAELCQKAGVQSPDYRIILGLGLPQLSHRTDDGKTIRYIAPGHNLFLSFIPLGRRMGAATLTLDTAEFTVVDDCKTDVWSIDKETVYIPFETLQLYNNMYPRYSVDDPPQLVQPARCTHVHVKVRKEHSRGLELVKVKNKIQNLCDDFLRRYPDASRTSISASTWREMQADLIGPIERQRTLSVIMFAIISMVSVVLIFVIFYMVVVQKTRDIGVLKAIGASNAGVAGIFLSYGAAVGLVGSVLGATGGYYFVRYINPIQDAVDRWFGFRVWTAKTFMFEEIPNQVNLSTAVSIVISAIIAGLVGAFIPAMRAARMHPVEALRYE